METLKSINREDNETERPILGVTSDGATVRDRIDSHFHPEGGLTKELLSEAISKISTDDRPFIVDQVDFEKPIGKTTCVDIGPEDKIDMVFRKLRNGRTPMVHDRKPEDTNSIVVVLSRDYDSPTSKDYTMRTSYTGELATREPWDPSINTPEEKQKCEDFWNTHALLYDESLIDNERTETFNNMSEEEQFAELVREKVVYAGLFIDANELYRKAPTTLEHQIEHPHVTTAFQPSTDQLHIEQLGQSARIFAIGYGNDGKNEGLLVRVETDDPELQKACDEIKTPHITLSISEGAHAKDTGSLFFTPLDEPFEISGNYGLFSQGNVITDANEL